MLVRQANSAAKIVGQHLLEQVYFRNGRFSHKLGGISVGQLEMRSARFSYADPDCLAIKATKNNLGERDTS